MTFFPAAIALVIAATATVPRIVSERTLLLDQPSDVRWADANHVFVADRRRGVARFDLADGGVTWLTEWPAPQGMGTNYTYLAASDKAVLVADFAFAFQWRERGNAAAHREQMEFIADVDLDGDRILLSGLRRDGEGKLGADGAVAWLGSLSGGARSLRPILPFTNRKAIEDCASFGLGTVRFLADGSFVVVPGAESGIYLFSKEGKLQRLWKTDVLGLDVACDFSREQQILFGTNPVARQEWVNRHRIVDDIVETPAGPAAIARRVTAKGTRWDLLVLGAAGSVSELPLPVESTSPWAHIAAATRGDRVVLLIADRIRSGNGAPPRLITLQWRRP